MCWVRRNFDWKYSACVRILHYVLWIQFTNFEVWKWDQVRMKYFFQAFKTQQNRYHHKAGFFFHSPFPPKWSQPAALWITLNPVRVIHHLCFEIQWYYCCTCWVPLPNLLTHLKKLSKQTPNQSPIFAIFVELSRENNMVDVIFFGFTQITFSSFAGLLLTSMGRIEFYKNYFFPFSIF